MNLNKNSKTAPKGYKLIKEVQDPRFGPIKLFKDPESGIHYCSKTEIFNSRKLAMKKLMEIEKRMHSPNIFYVSPADVAIQDANQFCASLYNLRVFYPYPGQDLRKEIRGRAREQSPFTNYEMTTLMYNLIYGMAHLEELGFCHKQLSPRWVALSTTGYAIMDDPLGASDRHLKVEEKDGVYCSPEVYRLILKAQESRFGRGVGLGGAGEPDFFKNDVYSGGLILVQAGLLSHDNGIYGSHDVNNSKIEQRVRMLKKRYPENVLLISTVERMLEYEPARRPTFAQIKQIIPDFNIVKDFFSAFPDSPAVVDPADVEAQKRLKLSQEHRRALIRGDNHQPMLVKQPEARERPRLSSVHDSRRAVLVSLTSKPNAHSPSFGSDNMSQAQLRNLLATSMPEYNKNQNLGNVGNNQETGEPNLTSNESFKPLYYNHLSPKAKNDPGQKNDQNQLFRPPSIGFNSQKQSMKSGVSGPESQPGGLGYTDPENTISTLSANRDPYYTRLPFDSAEKSPGGGMTHHSPAKQPINPQGQKRLMGQNHNRFGSRRASGQQDVVLRGSRPPRSRLSKSPARNRAPGSRNGSLPKNQQKPGLARPQGAQGAQNAPNFARQSYVPPPVTHTTSQVLDQSSVHAFSQRPLLPPQQQHQTLNHHHHHHPGHPPSPMRRHWQGASPHQNQVPNPATGGAVGNPGHQYQIPVQNQAKNQPQPQIQPLLPQIGQFGQKTVPGSHSPLFAIPGVQGGALKPTEVNQPAGLHRQSPQTPLVGHQGLVRSPSKLVASAIIPIQTPLSPTSKRQGLVPEKPKHILILPPVSPTTLSPSPSQKLVPLPHQAPPPYPRDHLSPGRNGFKFLSPDVIVSPSGLKMKKHVQENKIPTPQGGHYMTKNIRWEPLIGKEVSPTSPINQNDPTQNHTKQQLQGNPSPSRLNADPQVSRRAISPSRARHNDLRRSSNTPERVVLFNNKVNFSPVKQQLVSPTHPSNLLTAPNPGLTPRPSTAIQHQNSDRANKIQALPHLMTAGGLPVNAGLIPKPVSGRSIPNPSRSSSPVRGRKTPLRGSHQTPIPHHPAGLGAEKNLVAVSPSQRVIIAKNIVNVSPGLLAKISANNSPLRPANSSHSIKMGVDGVSGSPSPLSRSRHSAQRLPGGMNHNSRSRTREGANERPTRNLSQTKLPPKPKPLVSNQKVHPLHTSPSKAVHSVLLSPKALYKVPPNSGVPHTNPHQKPVPATQKVAAKPNIPIPALQALPGPITTATLAPGGGSSQQVVHHHHYHLPPGTEIQNDPLGRLSFTIPESAGSIPKPVIISPPRPLTLIPNPQQNIRIASQGAQKVVVDNPKYYQPEDAKQSHELDGLNTAQIPLNKDGKIFVKDGKKQLEFKKELDPNENAVECPIEDPRNPFHQEYLRLKRLNDGHLKLDNAPRATPSNRKRGVFSARGMFQENSPQINKTAANESENPLQASLTRKESEEPKRTLSRSRNQETAQRPYQTANPSIGFINNRENLPPLPEVDGGGYGKKKVTLDQYHYCDECDLAFKEGPPQNSMHLTRVPQYNPYIHGTGLTGHGKSPVMLKRYQGYPGV